MATVSLLGTQTLNTTSGTHTVVATPAVNDLIIIVRANTGNTTSTAPTDNAIGGTYSLVKNALKATSADLMEVWVRNSPITAASSTTFTDAAGTTTGGGLAVFKVTGMTRYGPDAIRQSAAQANQASGGTPTPVLGSAALTANPIIGAVFNATSAATLTPRASYTEAFDVGYSTPTTGLEAMFISSGETGTSIAWGSTSASAFCSVVVELDASSKAWTAIAVSDNFDDNSIDVTKWNALQPGSGRFAETAQTFQATTSAGGTTYDGLDTVGSFDLTGKFCFVEVVNAGNTALASVQTYIKVFPDSTHNLTFYIGNNTTNAQKDVAGVFTTMFSPAYSSTNHKWLGLGESNGVTYYLVSADGINWNVLYSVLNPITLTAVFVEIAIGTFAAEASATTATWDNFNITPSGTLHTQSLTAAMTPSGAFSKQTQRSFTAAMLSTGTLAKKVIRSFTASMLSTGVLNKNTRRALSASLGISGVLTASHLFFKSLTGALGLSGVLTRRTGKSLTGSLPLSGVLNKKTFHSFTASLTPSGVLTTLKAFTRSLTASMTPSGVLSKRTNRPLNGSLGLSGVLSRVAALKRSLTASLTPSGVLNKKTFRNLTGSMTPHGVVTSLKLFVRSFTASMTPSGTLSKQTRKSLTASISFVGLLTSFIPPIFTPIKRIISSFSNKAADGSSTNIANAGGGVTISDDSSPTNQSSVSSGPNDTIVSSGPNQETLEG